MSLALNIHPFTGVLSVTSGGALQALGPRRAHQGWSLVLPRPDPNHTEPLNFSGSHPNGPGSLKPQTKTCPRLCAQDLLSFSLCPNPCLQRMSWRAWLAVGDHNETFGMFTQLQCPRDGKGKLQASSPWLLCAGIAFECAKCCGQEMFWFARKQVSSQLLLLGGFHNGSVLISAHLHVSVTGQTTGNGCTELWYKQVGLQGFSWLHPTPGIPDTRLVTHFSAKHWASPGPCLEVTTPKQKPFLSIHPDLCMQSSPTAFCSEGRSV